MLIHLQIKDFTLVEHLDIELNKGLTTITGETGAGKSIMLDALGMVLGDRADQEKVRSQCNKAEILASFDISSMPLVKEWLDENDLGGANDCILRRIITKEGRSRAYINGHTAPLHQLRQLGDMLIDIHSQHEHQSLMKIATHRRMLDEFAEAEPLAKQVKTSFTQWQTIQQQLISAQTSSDEQNARYQLLRYQVEELDQLALQENELAELEEEQELLSNTDAIQHKCQQLVSLFSADEEGIKDRLQYALKIFADLTSLPPLLAEVESLLQSAAINIDEAQRDVERYMDSSDLNPERFEEINQRLTAIYDIARKHRVTPEQLFELHTSLAEEFAGLQTGDEQIETLQLRADQALEEYNAYALKLTDIRKETSTQMEQQVNHHLAELAMAHAKVTFSLDPLDAPSANGNEKVELLITTAPGQSPKPLNRIASGGELSRVSLAIQVVAAKTSHIPTLVFDEVDVGIGGTTGDIVGEMLRALGEKGQVFCVTHLAQVASKSHQHYQVEKTINDVSASSTLIKLNKQERIKEIARMMGGAIDSKQSLAHAKEMLKI